MNYKTTHPLQGSSNNPSYMEISTDIHEPPGSFNLYDCSGCFVSYPLFFLFLSGSNAFDNQTTNIIFTACDRGGWNQCWKTTFDPLIHILVLSLTFSSGNHDIQLADLDIIVLSF